MRDMHVHSSSAPSNGGNNNAANNQNYAQRLAIELPDCDATHALTREYSQCIITPPEYDQIFSFIYKFITYCKTLKDSLSYTNYVNRVQDGESAHCNEIPLMLQSGTISSDYKQLGLWMMMICPDLSSKTLVDAFFRFNIKELKSELTIAIPRFIETIQDPSLRHTVTKLFQKLNQQIKNNQHLLNTIYRADKPSIVKHMSSPLYEGCLFNQVAVLISIIIPNWQEVFN